MRTWTLYVGLALMWTLGSHSEAFASESERISRHLSTVETLLRSADVDHISPQQQEARAAHLDALNEYIERGVYPVNRGEFADRGPIFADQSGTWCAVGYLMATSGADELAGSIVAGGNLRYLDEVDEVGLAEWVEASGLSASELGLIQPTYGDRAYNRWQGVLDSSGVAGIRKAEAGHDAATAQITFCELAGAVLFDIAITRGDRELFDFVLEKKCDPSRGHFGSNNRVMSMASGITIGPLAAAAGSGSDWAVEKLLAAGADLGGVDHRPFPLWSAATNGHARIVVLLLSGGAKATQKAKTSHRGCRRGSTALHGLARRDLGAIEVKAALATAKALLEAGAKPDSKNEQGETPLSLAKEQGHEALLSLFEQHL